MLDLDRVAGTLNPRQLRTIPGHTTAWPVLGPLVIGADGTPWRYNSGKAVAVLGRPGYLNPNRSVIAIEIEGRAVAGPSEVQVAALVALVKYLRKAMPLLTGVLGHADFQGYKAC